MGKLSIEDRRSIVSKGIATKSVRQLAEELGVSPKTISNDVAALGLDISTRKVVGRSNVATKVVEKLSKEDRDARVVCMVYCESAFRVEELMLSSCDRYENTQSFDGSTEWVRGDLVSLMQLLISLVDTV